VQIEDKIKSKDIAHLKEGIELEDGQFRALEATVTEANKKGTWGFLAIEEGRNRIIRRVFAAMGLRIRRLVRIAIGPITISNIPAGEHRRLSKQEVISLLKASTSGH